MLNYNYGPLESFWGSMPRYDWDCWQMPGSQPWHNDLLWTTAAESPMPLSRPRLVAVSGARASFSLGRAAVSFSLGRAAVAFALAAPRAAFSLH
jgi:hypothetical protein